MPMPLLQIFANGCSYSVYLEEQARRGGFTTDAATIRAEVGRGGFGTALPRSGEH